MDLPEPYVARPYAGSADHAAMASILTEYRQYGGNPEMSTAEQFDVTYANLTNCDPANDIAVIETTDGEPVGYVRVYWEELQDGSRDYVLFAPMRPAHLGEAAFAAIGRRPRRPTCDRWPMASTTPDSGRTPRIPARASRPHDEAAWLEALGYGAVRFTASLQRPDLENIPDLPLPDGVEIRPVTPEMLRPILDAHHETFRGDWDFTEATEEDFQAISR